MRYVYLCLVVACIGLFAGGCTQNQRARTFGGTAVIQLEKCERLDMATWKVDNLWYLTHKDCNQAPKEYAMKEDSNFGVIEGTVIFKEQ